MDLSESRTPPLAIAVHVMALSVIMLLCLAFPSKSADVAAQSPLDVRLVIDDADYGIGDKITIRVLLENRSRRTQYVYVPLDWGESASFSLWIKDAASGKNVPQDFLADAISLPPRSADSFTRLLPGDLIGLQFVSSFSDLGIHGAGKYEFVAVYHSPIPSTMNFGLPIWSRESGSLTSNSLTVSVHD
jgi:hypothetical protein